MRGCQLRAAGLHAPILVLAPSHADEAPPPLRAGAYAGRGRSAAAAAVGAAARELPATVHVEVDTGLSRFGIHPRRRAGSDRPDRRTARRSGSAASTPTSPPPTKPMALPRRAAGALRGGPRSAVRAGIEVPLVHQDNSAAALVGPGIARHPDPPRHCPLRPVAVRRCVGPACAPPGSFAPHARGARPSNSRPATVFPTGALSSRNSPMRAALVPLGYADGYRRSLSGRGAMLLGGRARAGPRASLHGPDGHRRARRSRGRSSATRSSLSARRVTSASPPMRWRRWPGRSPTRSAPASAPASRATTCAAGARRDRDLQWPV